MSISDLEIVYFNTVDSRYLELSSSPVPELSLTPAHGDWNPAGKERVQHHLHAHAPFPPPLNRGKNHIWH